MMTRKTTRMTTLRQNLVETRDKLQSETDLATQVEGVGQIVGSCVDALQVPLAILSFVCPYVYFFFLSYFIEFTLTLSPLGRNGGVSRRRFNKDEFV